MEILQEKSAMKTFDQIEKLQAANQNWKKNNTKDGKKRQTNAQRFWGEKIDS